MTPEQASSLLAFIHPQIVGESKVTRKVMASVPEEKCDYSPDATSMCAVKLAAHIVLSERLFLHGILRG